MFTDIYVVAWICMSLSPSPCWAQSADPPSLVLLLITVLICPNISHQGCRTRSGQIVAPNISVFLGNEACRICQLQFAFADRVVLHAPKAWVTVELPPWVCLFVSHMCMIYEPEEGCISNHDQNVNFHQLLAEVSAYSAGSGSDSITFYKMCLSLRF